MIYQTPHVRTYESAKKETVISVNSNSIFIRVLLSVMLKTKWRDKSPFTSGWCLRQRWGMKRCKILWVWICVLTLFAIYFLDAMIFTVELLETRLVTRIPTEEAFLPWAEHLGCTFFSCFLTNRYHGSNTPTYWFTGKDLSVFHDPRTFFMGCQQTAVMVVGGNRHFLLFVMC